jgi:hypothetical protein
VDLLEGIAQVDTVSELREQLASLGVTGKDAVSKPADEVAVQLQDAREYFQERDATTASTSASAIKDWSAEEWTEVATSAGVRQLTLAKPVQIPVSNGFGHLKDFGEVWTDL